MVPSQKKPINLLIGYARVSTEDQANDAQMIESRAAGCDTLYEERRTGASQARPVLAKLIDKIRRGDALVVVRIDRLARSVSHLLAAIEELEDKKAHFRSLHDPMFSLQIPGAVAQLEWALISERTKAGVKAAKARGKFLAIPASVNCAESAANASRHEKEPSRGFDRNHVIMVANRATHAAGSSLRRRGAES